MSIIQEALRRKEAEQGMPPSSPAAPSLPIPPPSDARRPPAPPPLSARPRHHAQTRHRGVGAMVVVLLIVVGGVAAGAFFLARRSEDKVQELMGSSPPSAVPGPEAAEAQATGPRSGFGRAVEAAKRAVGLAEQRNEDIERRVAELQRQDPGLPAPVRATAEPPPPPVAPPSPATAPRAPAPSAPAVAVTPAPATESKSATAVIGDFLAGLRGGGPEKEPEATIRSSASDTLKWPKFSVRGILAPAQGNRGSVVLNDRILGLHEDLDGVQVVEIRSEEAVLEYKGARRTMRAGQSSP